MIVGLMEVQIPSIYFVAERRPQCIILVVQVSRYLSDQNSIFNSTLL